MARLITKMTMPMAARTAAVMRASTATGWPQRAPRSRDVATISTSMLVRPTTKVARTLPAMITPWVMGAASSRANVPEARSASRLRAPKPTVKKRKNKAMAGPK